MGNGFPGPRPKTTAGGAGIESLYIMNDAANIDTILVGIFEDAQELDRAAQRLNTEGFETEVFDDSVLTERTTVDPLPVGTVPAVAPAPAEQTNTVEADWSTINRAVKPLFADYKFPDEVLDSYATTLYRKGKLAVVRTEPELADQVIGIMRECGASRVDRHD
jgi:hypothetical protein